MSTSARMLQLLSLLQTHRFWGGDELAERLSVSPRTLRRDVDRLREQGYDVDASRGVGGGYQLRAGTALPPLLLTDEEAVAVAAGLHSAAAGGAPGLEETVVEALTKVTALMPPRLRRRMDALRTQTEGPSPWSGRERLEVGVLTTLAQGCRDAEGLRFDYIARGGEASHRRVEPLRLVTLGRRWYLVAYDLDRQDWRSFRCDRIAAPALTGQRFRRRELPADDAVAFVRRGIRERPQRYRVRVGIEAPAATVEGVMGRWGEVEPNGPERCVMTMSTDTLDWPVLVLANLDADFVVHEPGELADLLARLGRRVERSSV